MNASVDQLYTLFNNKMRDFLDDLQVVIGHLPEYSVLVASTSFISRMTPTQNHEYFLKYFVNAYGEQIASRDDSFFMDTSNVSFSPPEILLMLKKTWSNTQESDRKAVWDHLGVLLQISGYIQKKKKA